MKRYVLIAGVNGAGKSTLYELLDSLKQMERINVDEVVREIGAWDNVQDVMRAGKISVRKIRKFLNEGISFNQETTLCGKMIGQNIDIAKSRGYYIELHYVGLSDVEIAKERVRHRVSVGGHGISERDIERRYVESFRSLKQILPKCNLAAIYDNSTVFRRVAIYKNGRLVRLSKDVPGWYRKNLGEDA